MQPLFLLHEERVVKYHYIVELVSQEANTYGMQKCCRLF